MTLEGMQMGSYRLLRFLGSGAMGEVYLAEDTRIGRQVAIKILKNEANLYPTAQGKNDALRLFQREMKAITVLDHPNILPLFDFGEQATNKMNYTYMVMPFRSEGSLVDWLQRRNTTALLSPQEVIQIVHQAADALQHAHNRQLIHLDVKPSNFLIRHHEDSPHRPDVLLADFGIAKFTTATSTTSQTIRGTPAYMAPEQWAGTPATATDQYALAIMAYQLLTGKFPFEGNMQQVMYKHLQELPQPPSTLNPSLPADVDRVLLRALEKKPENRYPSIIDFANAFEQAWQDENTRAESLPPPTSYTTSSYNSQIGRGESPHRETSIPPTEYVVPPYRDPVTGTTKFRQGRYTYPMLAPLLKKSGITQLLIIILVIVFIGVSGSAFALLISKDNALSTTASPTSSTPVPVATPTFPSTVAIINGTWRGQGTFYNGQSPFDMLLTITGNGTTFSGTLTENAYNSEVTISGTILSSSNNSVRITFTDPSSISGGHIQLGCTYTATVANGIINGVWYYPGNSAPNGTIMLTES